MEAPVYRERPIAEFKFSTVISINMNLRKHRNDMGLDISGILILTRTSQAGTDPCWGVLTRFFKGWATPDGAAPVLHGVC